MACDKCNGSSVCWMCSGKGYQVNKTGRVVCRWCKGTKACSFCAKPLARSAKPLRANHLTVNSCPDCHASTVCKECNGTGDYWYNANRQDCGWCQGTGACCTCAKHLDVIEEISRKVTNGDLALAEVEIQQRFVALKSESQGTGQILGMGGAAVGAIVGSLVLPGIGTLIGAMLGKAGGDGINNDATRSETWQHADLLFLLAAIYQKQGRVAEARQCLIQGASICPNHHLTTEALRGL